MDLFSRSAKVFIKELKLCKKEAREEQELNNMMPTRNKLGRALSPETLENLLEVRESLHPDE